MIRARALVALLMAGGLLIAATLGWSSSSSGSPPSLEAIHSPLFTAAASPPGPAPSTAAEPTAQPLTHRAAVLQQFPCENCHGLDSGWRLPQGHAEFQGKTCESCHAPAPEPSPVAMHTVPGDTATGELCSLCHTDTVQLGTRPVAPEVSSLQACASCHGHDRPGAPPADHSGRSVTTCSLCHQTQTLAAQAVPHKVEGWGECSFCHGTDRLAPVKGGHLDIKDDECLQCHDAVEDPPAMPKAMLNHSEAKGGCTSCHGEGLLASFPVDHEGRTDTMCALCHNATAKPAPAAPHSLVGSRACSSCHSSESLVKVGHRSLNENACTACHVQSPGGVPSIPHTLSGRATCTDCHEPARLLAPGLAD